MANVVTTELVIMVAYGLCLLTIIERDQLMLTILFAGALYSPSPFIIIVGASGWAWTI